MPAKVEKAERKKAQYDAKILLHYNNACHSIHNMLRTYTTCHSPAPVEATSVVGSAWVVTLIVVVSAR